MRITLNEPELALEVNKVDTPTGTGWCVIMPDERKVLIKLRHGKWAANDVIDDQFVQAIGNEISRFLEAEHLGEPGNNYPVSNLRPKRVRVVKYLLSWIF